ncbi:Small-conductance mechanosensitive ion channel MscS [Hondaea fermentalgiana]|uniref:Small-conductance mechanosensitive ion channel MscS n=1 Tax=Hondaea fermentalgiana TaxID=2315210 RepID=A0A2R5GAM0_9STRA|nr:Small-conductance mechanosensitive ion channel MscS [Hondaea fermentalgiana]|eukprot:GBG25131.1 Small-conductance mechanosensitive ion channel MscS [Hondaea fermentalgiana]
MSLGVDVKATSWVVLGTGLAGLATIRAQHGFVVSLVTTLAEESQLAMLLVRKAVRLLSLPLTILLYMLWVYVTASSDLVPNVVQSIVQDLLALAALIFSPFLIYRILRYAEFAALFVAKERVRDPLIVEYLRNTLPLLVVVASVVLAIVDFLVYLRRARELSEAVISLLYSFVGVIVILGAITLFRDAVGSLTLLVDQEIKIGDIIQIRGVTGRVLRIGAVDVAVLQGGYRTMHLPSSDFLVWPFINHSKADRRGGVVRLQLRESVGPPRSAEAYRCLARDIKTFLEADDAVQRCSVNFFASGSDVSHPSTHLPSRRLRTSTSCFLVVWETTPGPHLSYSRSRSGVVLRLTEWLESCNIQLEPWHVSQVAYSSRARALQVTS